MAAVESGHYFASPPPVRRPINATLSHSHPMSDISHGDDAGDRAGSDRRSNLALRELIDEMMTSIRTATQGHLWTSDERAQYERELSMIMTRVRSEAVGPTRPARVGAD